MDEHARKGLLHGIGDNWKTLDQGASTLVVAGFDPALYGELISCPGHSNRMYADKITQKR